MTPNVNLLASVRRHPLYILFTSSQGAVFLVNSRQRDFSCGPHFTVGRPYPEVTAAFLPSSLTRTHSFPLGYSPYPPVAVSGTEPHASQRPLNKYNKILVNTCWICSEGAYLEIFLGRLFIRIGTAKTIPFFNAQILSLKTALRICLEYNFSRQKHQTIKTPGLISFVFPSVSHIWRAGILTSCPSTTAFAIALGPPNPPSISVAEETLDFRGARFSPAL